VRPLRALAAVVVLAGMGAIATVAADPSDSVVPVFAALGEPTMPFVPNGSFITSSWFCPGVPAGEGDVGGSVEITNPADQPIAGRLTVFSSTPGMVPATRSITIEGRSTQSIDLKEMQTGTFVSALVEIDGGGGFVEQVARHPAGDAVAACSNAASSNWYFADGFTADDSTEQIVLTNPYPDAAIVDIGFVTSAGVRNPSALQGYPVPGHSVQVVELGARDEPMLAAQVVASRGRVVAGRAQHYLGGGRLGYSMTLGAPSLTSQAWFVDGEVGEGITEQYAVFNPTDQDVSVTAVFLGLPATEGFANDTELQVPKGKVVLLSTADVVGLPPGRHGAVFSTLSTASIVVERVISRPAGNLVATSVVMGSPPALASTRWSAAAGAEVATENAILVLNVDSVDTTVTVSSLGPGGLVPVPGLESVALPAGAVVALPLTDPSALGRPFVVESGQRIYVERSLSRGGDLPGRSGSFALAG
jgi:hypothetical protein